MLWTKPAITSDTDWGTPDNRKGLSHSSGGHQSEIKVSAVLCSLWRFWKRFLPCLLPQQAVASHLWFSLACVYTSAISASAHPWPPSLHICAYASKLPSFHKTPVILDLGPTLILYDPILTNYICKDPSSKYGHILRFWVDMNSGGNPTHHCPPVHALIETTMNT